MYCQYHGVWNCCAKECQLPKPEAKPLPDWVRERMPKGKTK